MDRIMPRILLIRSNLPAAGLRQGGISLRSLRLVLPNTVAMPTEKGIR